MPGRLAIFDDSDFKKDLENIFISFNDEVLSLKPSYNVAPTNQIPVFLNSRKYTLASFGLIASYAKNDKTININARCETIFEKVTFRECFKNKRCLIPINGFYEWKTQNKQKQAFLISPLKNKYLALAGIYEYWFDMKKNKNILSVALITTNPNELVSTIHDRMPVILEQKDYKMYLDENSSLSDLNSVLKPCSSDILQTKELSSYVNSVKNNSKKCLEDKESESKEYKTLFDF